MGMLIDDALRTGEAERAAGKAPADTFVYRRIAVAKQPA